MRFTSNVFAASLIVCSTLSSVVGGCNDGPIELQNSLPETALIANVPFEGGGSLRFYEPEPGMLIEVEQGPEDAPRERAPGEESMSAAEKYALLTGQTAPARLVAASAAVAHVQSSQAPTSLEKGLSGQDISGPGLREDFLRLYCQQTDRRYWHLGYDKESLHVADGANYYAWGVNALQGPTVFRTVVRRFNNDIVMEFELPEGWYGGSVIKVGGAGRDISSFAKGRAPGALFDHCVNFHY